MVCIAPDTLFSQKLIWEANHGGIYNEGGYAGLQTLDGGYIILGDSYSFGAGKFDIYLLKLSSAGDTIWTRTYGGSDTEYGYDIVGTADSGFIIVGSTRSYGNGKRDVYLIRTDSTGEIMWSTTYGGTEDDEGRSVRQTADNGFIICGTTNSSGAGYSDLYLIKTDSLGDTIWVRAFGGAGGESGFAVRQTHDLGYIAIGSTGSFGEGYSSVYVVRVSSDGDSLWAVTYGGNRADLGYSVEVTPDGGYLFAGATASFGAGSTDGYLVKTDSLGNLEWEQTYGGAWDDRLYSVCLAMDGGYLLAGTTDSYGAGKLDMYMIKTTPLGDTAWTRTYGGSESDYGRMVFQEQGRDYILIGESYSSSSGGSDICIMKIRGESTPVEEDDPYYLPSMYELAQNYPNPFNLSTTIRYTLPRRSVIELTIYNILGQVVREWSFGSKGAGVHLVLWDGRNDSGVDAASGVYFYRLTAGEFIETKKMVLVK